MSRQPTEPEPEPEPDPVPETGEHDPAANRFDRDPAALEERARAGDRPDASDTGSDGRDGTDPGGAMDGSRPDARPGSSHGHTPDHDLDPAVEGPDRLEAHPEAGPPDVGNDRLKDPKPERAVVRVPYPRANRTVTDAATGGDTDGNEGETATNGNENGGDA